MAASVCRRSEADVARASPALPRETSASVPDSKVFISDLGADGLKAKREENQPFDTAELHGKSYSFDGDWKRAKLSEDEYMKQYQQAEQEYENMLQALLGQLKKTS